MIVAQPKIPFANDSKIPNITFTFKFNSDEETREAMKILYKLLFDSEYYFNQSDFGSYLICYLY